MSSHCTLESRKTDISHHWIFLIGVCNGRRSHQTFFHWGLHLKSSIREQPDSCIMVVQFAIFLHLNKYWFEKNDFVLIITDLNTNYFALHSGVNFRILHSKPLKPSSVTIFILQIQNEVFLWVSFLFNNFFLKKENLCSQNRLWICQWFLPVMNISVCSTSSYSKYFLYQSFLFTKQI